MKLKVKAFSGLDVNEIKSKYGRSTESEMKLTIGLNALLNENWSLRMVKFTNENGLLSTAEVMNEYF